MLNWTFHSVSCPVRAPSQADWNRIGHLQWRMMLQWATSSQADHRSQGQASPVNQWLATVIRRADCHLLVRGVLGTRPQCSSSRRPSKPQAHYLRFLSSLSLNKATASSSFACLFVLGDSCWNHCHLASSRSHLAMFPSWISVAEGKSVFHAHTRLQHPE